MIKCTESINNNNNDPTTAGSKELLLDAAKKVFAKKGYDGATVKDLSDAAGVNVSLISYYFGGKEGLYRECIERFGQERLALATEILSHPQSLEDFRVKLRIFTLQFIETHIRERDATTILHRECSFEFAQTKDIFANTFLKAFNTLVSFMRDAQQKGILSREMDVQAAAAFYYGAILHFSKTDGIQKEFFGASIEDPVHREKIADQSIQIFLQGVVAKSS